MRRSGVGSMGMRLGVVLSAWLAGLHALVAFAGPPFVVASDFFIGGIGHDRVTDLVVDAAGNAYVSGVVGSYNFPGISSAAITNGGMDLRFVARIPSLSRSASFVAVVGSPTAALADAHLSKFGADEAAGLAVDASGNAYLVAYEGSRDYPIVGGRYQGTTGKKYVFKVSASGAVSKVSNALDPAINRVGGVAVDKTGAIYLTGSARDGLQTTAGAPYPTGRVAVDCIAPYVMKLDATTPRPFCTRPISAIPERRGRSAAAASTRQTSSRPISIPPVTPLRSTTAEMPTSQGRRSRDCRRLRVHPISARRRSAPPASTTW